MFEVNIKSALNQLIEHHLNHAELINEQSEDRKGSTYNGEQPILSIINNSLSLNDEAVRRKTSVLAQRLKCQSQTTYNLCAENNMDELHALLLEIKVLQRNTQFSKQQFAELLAKNSVLPVDVLWLLHKENIFSLDSYLNSKLSRPSDIGKISYEIIHISTHNESNLKLRIETIEGIMKVVMEFGYIQSVDFSDSLSKSLRKISCALLDNITKKYVQLGKNADISIFSFIKNYICQEDSDETKTGLKNFCCAQIRLLLSLLPNLTVRDAALQQHNWRFVMVSPLRTQIYRELLLLFDCEEAVTILKDVLLEEEVNWESVLSFTATLVLCYEEAANLIKSFCKELIQIGLEQCEQENLITAFLLVRQCALEGSHIFPQYQQWFQSLFGDQNSLAGNKKSFSFLIKFLSDIVPFENAHYLKAHLWKHPYIPSVCRQIWSDYQMLAKTRIMDLGQPFEDNCLVNENTGDSVIEQAQADVEKALTSYSRNGKIPSMVIEASVFRKPYFVTRFLPALLTPRPLPDKPDNKMCFIETLMKADKISESLYKTYYSSCRKISNQLLQGVFDDEDEEMDMLLLSPWEQYESSLQALITAVTNTKSQDSLNICLSQLYDKICLNLNVENNMQGNFGQDLIINITKPNFVEKTVQVIDSLLTTVCDILKQNVSHMSQSWLSKLLLLLSNNIKLYECFIMRILHFIQCQLQALEDDQLNCLSVLAVVLCQSPTLPTVFISNRDETSNILQKFFWKHIVYCNKDLFIASFKFLTFYLEFISVTYSLNAEHLALPSEFIKMFTYMMLRVQHGDYTHKLSKNILHCAITLFQSEEYQKLNEKYELTLQEWLTFEKQVNPAEDIFHDLNRYLYYDYMISVVLQPKSIVSKDNDFWVKNVCSCIAEEILNNHFGYRCNWCVNCSAQKYLGNIQSSFINLLQRYTNKLRSKSTRDTPWLIDFCSHIVQKCDTSAQCDLVKLLLQLSPHLIFTDSLLQLEKNLSVQPFIEIVKSLFVTTESEGPILSLSVSLYILQCLLLIKDDHLVFQIFENCSVITLSFQFYWAKIKHMVHGSDTEKCFSIFHQIDNFCKSFLMKKIDINNKLIMNHQKQFCIATCYYLQNSNFDADVLVKLMKISPVLAKHIGVMLALFETHKIFDDQVFVGNRGSSKMLLLQIFFLYPDQFIMDVVDIMSTLNMEVAKQYPVELQAYALLRCVFSLKEEACYLWKSSNCVVTVLKLYEKARQAYEEGISNNISIKHTSTLKHVMDVTLLHEIVAWIKSNVKMLSKDILAQISKEKIQISDIELRSFVAKF